MTGRLRFCAALALVLAAVTAGLGAVSEDADAAWARGDHEEALRLYEARLDAAPHDIRALFRSAQLHAWTRRFEASVERWDRLLALDPDNASARLERAKTLSWWGKHREAARAFEEILEAEPDHRAARLGLARTLSWSGRQEDARAEYEKMLASDPLDLDALVGVAQTLAWSGRLEESRDAYERVLALDPNHEPALLGLAYTDVWTGRHEDARRRIARLESLDPEEAELAELKKAERRARAPWIRLSYDRLSDSDDTERDIYSVLWGRRLVRPVDLVLGLERHEPRSPRLEASVTRLFGAANWRATKSWRFYGRAGVDRSEDTRGASRSAAVGSLSAIRALGGGWETGAALARDTLIYSPAITDAEIEIDRLLLHVEGPPWNSWRVRVEAGAAHFSDGNDRLEASAGLWRAWKPGRITLEIGPVARFLDYSDDLDNGYFDPGNFTSLLVEARARGELGDGDTYLDARLEGGWQSFTIGGVDVNGDGVFGGRLLLGRWLSERFAVEIYAAYSDYAVESATGFDFTQFGVRLRYRWVN